MPIVYLRRVYAAAGVMMTTPPDRQRVSPWSDAAAATATQILTLSCLTVSIASLLFLLATYSTFPELRTLPGINNIFLASWLLAAQVLLLAVPARTEVKSLCRVLGAALHYCWLCVVGWSTACSFHMFHVFVTQRDLMHAPHRQRWYVKRYALFSHGLPAAIVALVVACTLWVTDGEDVGYGGHVCYLNSALLRGVAFVLPLALAVTFNLVQLGLTARELSHAQRVQSYSGGGRLHSAEDSSSNVPIYAKLSSLTGCCWLVALLSEVPGCWWLGYLSTVLNGLQGLHLAASYAGNRRVARLWRRKLARKGMRRSTKAETSSNSASSSAARDQSRQTLSSAV